VENPVAIGLLSIKTPKTLMDCIFEQHPEDHEPAFNTGAIKSLPALFLEK
jgi:hypothetical protein